MKKEITKTQNQETQSQPKVSEAIANTETPRYPKAEWYKDDFVWDETNRVSLPYSDRPPGEGTTLIKTSPDSYYEKGGGYYRKDSFPFVHVGRNSIAGPFNELLFNPVTIERIHSKCYVTITQREDTASAINHIEAIATALYYAVLSGIPVQDIAFAIRLEEGPGNSPEKPWILPQRLYWNGTCFMYDRNGLEKIEKEPFSLKHLFVERAVKRSGHYPPAKTIDPPIPTLDFRHREKEVI